MEIYNVGLDGFNSYLIKGDKTILIDTVPKNLIAGFFKNIEQHTSIFKIDYMVFLRTTPDASGAFCTLLKENPNIKVFASVAGLKNLKEIANQSFSENVVKNLGSIDIGEDSLEFLITPNLSWPDTFIAYLKNEKALFSGNLFCENPETEYMQKEFLMPALVQIKSLEVQPIYPAYNTFSGYDIYKSVLEYEPKEKLLILYATHSGATEELAKVVCLESLSFGISAVMMNVSQKTEAEILSSMDSCKYWAFGTPTIHHNASAELINIISKINVTKNSGKKAFIFGSYGWSGEGVNIISTLLQNLKIKASKKTYRCIFNPSADNIEKLRTDVNNFLKEVREDA